MKVAQLTKTTKKCTLRSSAIKDSQGSLPTEEKDVKARWKEYIEELYSADQKPKWEDFSMEVEEAVEADSLGPEILDSEVEAAVSELKNGKAPGVDGIPGELLKMLGEDAMNILKEICNDICEKGQ